MKLFSWTIVHVYVYLKLVLPSSYHLLLITMLNHGESSFWKHFAQVIYVYGDYNKHLPLLVSSIVNRRVLLHALFIYSNKREQKLDE